MTEGRLVARAARTAILRYPLSTALPIPLAITAPAAIRLVTWAFSGLDADDAQGPRGLLVLERDEGAALPASLRLATHFQEFDIEVDIAIGGSAPNERALIARALLSVASPDETGTLADLIEWLDTEVSAIAPEADAPAIMPREDGRWRLSGSDMPGHLLLREGAGWSCHRVARASLFFGGPEPGTGSAPPPPQDEGVGRTSGTSTGPHAVLTLEPIWGKTPAGRPDRAIGLAKNGFTAYRIAG